MLKRIDAWALVAAGALSGMAGSAAWAVEQDVGMIDFEIDAGYELVGQSAFMQTTTTGGTSGAQLDNRSGVGSLRFVEIFPQAALTDYISYSYVGIVNTMGTDGNGDPVVEDQSLVVGYKSSAVPSVLGQTVADIFAGYTESQLVTAMTTQLDSPEFEDLAFNLVGGQPDTSADTRLITSLATTLDISDISFDSNPTTEVEPGETLYFIAFVGGALGDEGLQIGQFDFTMNRQTLVPEPASAVLLLAGCGLMLRCRRSA